MGTTADKLNAVLASKNSIKNAIVAKGVSVPDNTPLSQYASKINSITTGSGGGGSSFIKWEPPVEWLTLPEPIDGIEKVSALIGVNPDGRNFAVFKIICDTEYYVDWGDGSSSVIPSNTVAYHTYDYNNVNLNDNTVSTFGYKQCIITITGNNITSFSLQENRPNENYSTNYGTQTNMPASSILDIVINLKYCVSINTFTKYDGVYYKIYIKYFNLNRIILGELGDITSFAYLCGSDGQLYRCILLKTYPKVLNYIRAFACAWLQDMPITDFSGGEGLNLMSCYQGIGANVYGYLNNNQTISNNDFTFNINYTGTSILYISSMFSNYSYTSKKLTLNINSPVDISLSSVAYGAKISDMEINSIGDGKIISLESCFSSSFITKLPDINDTSSCSNYGYTFSYCKYLKSADLSKYDFSKNITFNNTFNGCSSLSSVSGTVILNTNVASIGAQTTFAGCSLLDFNCNFINLNLIKFTSGLDLLFPPTNNTLEYGEIFIDSSHTNCLKSFSQNSMGFFGLSSNNRSTKLVSPSVKIKNTSFVLYNPASYPSTLGCQGTSASIGYISQFAVSVPFSFSIAYNQLDANALNEMFTCLPTVVGKQVTVFGNPGTVQPGYDPSIATAKGWTVIS